MTSTETDTDDTDRSSAVERFEGPDYLTRFEPDPDAIARLKEIPSETAHRLVKYVTGDWPGILSSEDFLGPLTAAEGDIVFRVINTPGSDWVWWRGDAGDRHWYGRVHGLPHYHDHKLTSRRKASADKLADVLTEGAVIPVHTKNVPESVWDCISHDRPYRDSPLETLREDE